MVDLLDGSGPLTDQGGRALWRQFVREDIPELRPEPFRYARQELLHVVFESSDVGAVEELVDATLLVDPLLDPELPRLRDEWLVCRSFPGADPEPLRRALDLPVAELQRIFLAATDGRDRMPRHCTTAWHAFAYLAGRNARTDTLLPWMVLLEHVALCPEAAAAVGEIRAWNDHFAAEWDMADGDHGIKVLRDRLHGRDQGLPSAEESRAVTGAPEKEGVEETGSPLIHLYAKVVPDHRPYGSGTGPGGSASRDPARYFVSACVKFADSSTLHQDTGRASETPVPREDVPATVADLLTRMAQLWHARSEHIVLEFFLPFELLNEPVEWWDRDPGLGYANPLLSKYRDIRLHSLERVQRREFHHSWRFRWKQWARSGGPGTVHESDPGDLAPNDHLARLDATIGRDDDVVGMILSQPPGTADGLGRREVRLAIDLGIPIVLYHRQDSLSEEFRSLVRETLAQDGLVILPARTQQWKSESAAERDASPDHEVVRSMGCVWDDPEHLLDSGVSAPATFVGGTE